VDVVLVLRAPRALFYGAGQGLPPPNRIRLRLQPDAGVTFALLAKPPGGRDVATEIPVSVDLRTALGAAEQPYERILADALAGDPAHSARMDNVEEAWRIVGPALDLGTEPPRIRLGSWGPAAADAMPGERGWQPLPDPPDHRPPPVPIRRKRPARDLMAGNGGWHGPGRRGHDQGRPVPGVPHPRPPRRRSRDKEQR
jgi:hypothetical protein